MTTALVFPKVTFVGCDKKVGNLYTDKAAAEYVEENKVHDEDATYEFHCCNVNNAIYCGFL